MAEKGSRVKIEKRRRDILDILERESKVYISELSEIFGASLVTIRSDLDALEAEGKLVRMAGGAVLNNTGSAEPNIENREKKEKIAKEAVEFISDGDTLFINSGTTTLLVAEELKSRKNLNIVTNSLKIASLLGKVPTFRVILLGGSVNSQYEFTYGADTQEYLNSFGADWAVLSVDGISAAGEISTCHAEEAIIDRIMISRSERVLIVADDSKIGRTGFSFVAKCDDKTKIITNKNIV